MTEEKKKLEITVRVCVGDAKNDLKILNTLILEGWNLVDISYSIITGVDFCLEREF